MHKLSSILAMTVLLPAAACGGADESEPATGVAANEISFATGEFEVPPGDSFECFYTDKFTDRELSVVSSYGQQGPGGHHIVVYYTDEARDPTHHPCSDDEMTSWHQIAGSAGDAGEAIGLPEGLAIKVPAGKQLVLQAHYINTTGAPQKVNDTATLVLGEPSEIRDYANYLVTLDEGFEVPPLSKYTHTTYCTLDRDFDVVLSLGHMHEYGTAYSLEVVDEAGAMTQSLRDDAWEPSFTSHPPISRYSMDEPLHLPKGTRLKQSCSWNNTQDHPLLFPHEMCLAFFYYYPDQGELICEAVEEGK